MEIAIANHKGGSGKTTTTLNLGCVLRDLGFRVLLIDLDPQGNLSYSLGVNNFPFTSADWLIGRTTLSETAFEVSGLHLVPADLRLSNLENEIKALGNSQILLRKRMEGVSYDFVLIDCPPAFNVYSRNALSVSDFVLIPMLMDVLSIQGTLQMLKIIEQVRLTSNEALKVLGAVGVAVNGSRKLSNEISEYLAEHCNVKLFNQKIRNSVKVAEAPSHAQSVIDYAPESSSALDYRNLAQEILTEIRKRSQEKLKINSLGS